MKSTVKSENNISIIGIAFSIIVFVGITLSLFFIVDKAGGLNQLRIIVEQAGPKAPIIYITLKAMIFVAAPLSGLPFQISAGTMFGFWQSILYTLTGSLLGGSINFWVARFLGQPLITKLVGKKGMFKIDDYSRKISGWKLLLFARIFLSPVYDFISYAVGLTKLPFRQYVIVSAIGALIPTFLWGAFGASIGGDQKTFILISFGITIFYLCVFIFKSYFLNNIQKHNEPTKKKSSSESLK